MTNYIVKEKFPTNKEFNKLFSSVNWGTRDVEKIEKHRKSSCYAICVYIGDEIVGMARIVGDGSYYTIYDVVVDKHYQSKGIGRLIMERIILWYKSIEDDDTYLYLGASAGKEKFYEKFGFKVRPYGCVGAGMIYEIN